MRHARRFAPASAVALALLVTVTGVRPPLGGQGAGPPDALAGSQRTPVPPGLCPPDAVPVGPVCVDRYEAGVWETTDAALIARIRAGTATLADLAAAGAIQ